MDSDNNYDVKQEVDISVSDFDSLCKQLFEQKAKVDEVGKVYDAEKEKFEDIKSKILFIMEETEKTKYHLEGYGLIYSVNKFSVKTPKTLEEKKALGKYMNERGIFWEYFSVNSATLNSFYEEEFEKAKEAGNIDWKLPGVGEPSFRTTLSIRKDTK